MELDGRVAVVTGAASGIGRALAERFLAEGMRVAMADVEVDALLAAAAEVDASGARVLPVVTDVSIAAQVQALADAAEERFGAVHLLCNNAGVNLVGPAWELDAEDWSWVIGVNLWGVIHGIHAFVPRFIAQGEGHVVNTSSMAGVALMPGLAPYTASKHAVAALSESLAAELSMRDINVRVSVLCPGFVRTRIAESERNRPPRLGSTKRHRVSNEVLGMLATGMPPEDVAALVTSAVREERFWIFTHPPMLSLVEDRMRSILDGTGPIDSSTTNPDRTPPAGRG